MKKNTIQRKQMWATVTQELTMGLDLGDRRSELCVVDAGGEVAWRESVTTTEGSLKTLFTEAPTSMVVIEVGTHSPWVSRLLESLGHRVIVANAREVSYVTRSSRKSDKVDAESLARLGRADPKLLCPIRHRGETAQATLSIIRARAALVEARTKLINSARGIAKAMGQRLKACDADQAGAALLAGCSELLGKALTGLLTGVEELTEQIRAYDEQIASASESYQETGALRQVYGVGQLVALTYVLTLDDPERFRRSRQVGPYLGLRPRESQSGNRQPQLRITKEGDRYLRTLLVQSAQCLLRKNAPDSDLKRFGDRLAARGGPNARKRALVAVARKLGVLLHRLWVTGEVYEPLYNASRESVAKVA
jgi:transposase